MAFLSKSILRAIKAATDELDGLTITSQYLVPLFRAGINTVVVRVLLIVH